MSSPASPSPAFPTSGLADWLSLIVEGLLGVLGVRADKQRSLAPLMHLAWVKIEALSARFARLVAAFEAGVLPAPRTGGGGGHRGRRVQNHKPPRPQYGDPTIPSRLPSKFGWLIEAAPDSAAFVGQVEAWLEHPDLPVLLAEAPQAEAYLRPLLRMLGSSRGRRWWRPEPARRRRGASGGRRGPPCWPRPTGRR